MLRTREAVLDLFDVRYLKEYWSFSERKVVDDLEEEKIKRRNFFDKIIGKDCNKTYKTLDNFDIAFWDYMFDELRQKFWPIQYPRWYTHDRKGWNNIKDALYELCLLFWVDPLKVMVKEKRWRFDINSSHNPVGFIDAWIKLEELSEQTCQICGKKWTARDLPWVRTLCFKHHMKEYRGRQYRMVVYKFRKLFNIKW
jgi:hypothetical protein